MKWISISVVITVAWVALTSRTASASPAPSPGGTSENSPTFQRWVTHDTYRMSPERTVERGDVPSTVRNVGISEAVIAEVIPIKYAMASEIAGVLDRLSTKKGDVVKAGQASFEQAPRMGTSSAFRRFDPVFQRLIDKAGPLPKLGPIKTVVDERTNALLVYATGHDLVKIKDIISKLDVVMAQDLDRSAGL